MTELISSEEHRSFQSAFVLWRIGCVVGCLGVLLAIFMTGDLPFHSGAMVQTALR